MYTKSFNTKKTWLGAMFTFALVAIMGLTFAFKPFNKESKNANAKVTTYYYTGSDVAGANDPSNWSSDPGDASPCGGLAQIPCQVTVPTTIDSYLEDKTDQDIMEDTNVSKRPFE
ncbi:hypothetical protein [Pedobacter jamesrossensis]|uniref:Uncharacterized protein n=1 Tax=Pedobacter jamesrossensis TaxID=1908238 RepID=A0ABV8NI40_9SPHI